MVKVYLFLKLIKWSGFPGMVFSCPSFMKTIQLKYIPVCMTGQHVNKTE